jgi:hypothetical protein
LRGEWEGPGDATLRALARGCEIAPFGRGDDLGGDVCGVAAAVAVAAARVVLVAVFGAVDWGRSPRSVMVVVTRCELTTLEAVVAPLLRLLVPLEDGGEGRTAGATTRLVGAAGPWMGERRLCVRFWVTAAAAKRGLGAAVVAEPLGVVIFAWLGLFRGRKLLGLVVMAAVSGLPLTRGDVV